MAFIEHYMLALLVVALMLFGLYTAVRLFSRGRLVGAADRRLVSVIESTYLAQNTTLHLIKAGDRYYLIGGGSGHVNTLAEVPPDQVEPWLRRERDAFTQQTQSFAGWLKHLRKPR
jgi:flagellar biogenesis protein FliO